MRDTGGAQLSTAVPEVALLAARRWSQVEHMGADELAIVVDAAGDDALARHPAALLHLARALEPGLRYEGRAGVLDRLTALLGDPRPTAAGRPSDALALEVMAERAIDASRNSHLDAAEELAREVLARSEGADGPAHRPGRGDRYAANLRAREALGRALAWRGDRHSAVTARRWLDEAADGYHRLGSTEWEGAVRIWAGNAVHFQWGELDRAEAAMQAGFAVLSPESPRRALLLTFLAEVLLTRGRTDEVEAVLAEADELAADQDDPAAVAYAAWVRARTASLAGDASATARWLLDVERHRADWWLGTSGPTFLGDAAEMLDRVGDHAAADRYLTQAVERAPDDEFVAQAAAFIAARRGDPEDALRRLRLLSHSPWLERRTAWRRSLFEAYAALRARRPEAGALAARSFDEAVALGGIEVATTGEPALVEMLTPLAAASASRAAVDLLVATRGHIVRVLGDVVITGPSGDVALPAGAGATLVRLLAVHPAGLEIDEVIDALWPDLDAPTGRRRLRDVRFRLRARSGDLVGLEGTRLRLVGCWVDAVAFRAAADRALAHNGERTAGIAGALALWTGEPLPTDLYADWAIHPRRELRRRHFQLLDAAVIDAEARDSLGEACALLEEAIEAEPEEESRYLRLADHHVARGRPGPARRTLQRATAVATGLGLRPSPGVERRAAELDGSHPRD